MHDPLPDGWNRSANCGAAKPTITPTICCGSTTTAVTGGFPARCRTRSSSGMRRRPRPGRGGSRLLRRRHLARRRRVAPRRPGVFARGRGRLQHRAGLAEPWRRHRVAGTHAAERAQPRHHASEDALPRQQSAHAATGAQVRGRAVVRFRQRGRQGRAAALDDAVADARGDERRSRRRQRRARSAKPAVRAPA